MAARGAIRLVEPPAETKRSEEGPRSAESRGGLGWFNAGGFVAAVIHFFEISMFDRGSWNRTQRRYGTRERRSAIRNVLPLMVATMVIVAALAMLLGSGHGRTATVTVAAGSTPAVGLGSAGTTIASASPSRPAALMSPRHARPLRGPRGARSPGGASGPVPVSSSVQRVHATMALHVGARSRMRGRRHASRTPMQRTAVVAQARPSSPLPSGSAVLASRSASVGPSQRRPPAAVVARSQAPAAQTPAAVPHPFVTVSSGPSCYPGLLGC
jgi:hypothetical protein